MWAGNVENRLSNDDTLYSEKKSAATSTGKAFGKRKKQEVTCVHTFVMKTCNWVRDGTALLIVTISTR